MSRSRKPIQPYAAAVLLAVFVVAPSVTKMGTGRVAAATPDLKTTPRIDNFGKINANYYRGAEPDDAVYADLAAFGIKTIVDLRSDDVDVEDKALAEHAGMTYVQMPMTTHEPPTAAMIERFLAIVDSPENQPVYVHCVGGKHRTGVMTAVYRMTRDGWTGEQAFKEMKTYNFGADFLHKEFKSFVYSYQPAESLARLAATN